MSSYTCFIQQESGFYCSSRYLVLQKNSSMTTFILIHGSWHSAWNWHRVLPILKERGHRAIAIDLPGMGRDKTPVQQVKFDSTVDYICDIFCEIAGSADHTVSHKYSENEIV
jgi:pimeloyl-ACP methyl ester carboxylesterase